MPKEVGTARCRGMFAKACEILLVLLTPLSSRTTPSLARCCISMHPVAEELDGVPLFDKVPSRDIYRPPSRLWLVLQ